MSGLDAERWKESMRDEAQSLICHDVFDWVAPPEGVNPIPTKLIHKWKYKQDGIPIRPKSRIVVQGFFEADTGADKAAPVASIESVHLLIGIPARHGPVLKQADIKTAFLHAGTPTDAAPIYVSSVCRNKLDRFSSSRRGFTVCASSRRDGMAHFMCIC